MMAELIALATAALILLAATPARAAVGYQPAADPVFASGFEFPHGVAVDQTNHRVYVAVVSDKLIEIKPGELRRYESNGQPAGIFTAGSEAFFSGVAVNQATQGFYGAQVPLMTPLGDFGAAQVDPFTAAGVMGTPLPMATSETFTQIAIDASGDIYYPNAATDSVQVFSAAGVLQETIVCSGCPGGAFDTPSTLALDSDGNLYVVDLDPDRVIKFSLSGGSYAYHSILQSGRGAAAVGVDPSTNDVFVGDVSPSDEDYHVVAYTSAGVQFDDFGADMLIAPPLGPAAAGQIAVDESTHRLYIGEINELLVFERATINPPSATDKPASPVGQLTATLNAIVNAHGHATLTCSFEYTEEADVGFAGATSVPCSELPDGASDTTISAKVSGLSPDTGYRFRVSTANNGGSVTSSGMLFETLPLIPPTVTTEPALAVTQTSAKIEGKVNPHGGSASACRFELGTSAAYGIDLACASLPDPVSTDVAEEQAVASLTPGTTYHYRLVVTTNAGTVAGDDVEFTTASPPAPPQDPDPTPSTPAESPPPSSPPPPVVGPVTPTPPLRCKKGFRKKRVHGKLRCVKKKRARRAGRPRPALAGRR
jgi:hypothetical protein